MKSSNRESRRQTSPKLNMTTEEIQEPQAEEATNTASEAPLIDVEHLTKSFRRNASALDALFFWREEERLVAIDDVTLELHENEIVGVIGESGCGKTTLLMTLMGLHEPTDGAIRMRGEDVTTFNRTQMKEFRSNVQIIFQDPFNALDPKMTVQESLQEPLKIHDINVDFDDRVQEVLGQVELNPAEDYLNRTPGQLSGGEKQRVAIARALMVEPEVILADEPVSMLDVSTQAAVLNLLQDLCDELGVSIFYVSHDISTVGYICDSINVMYLGRVVESAPTKQVLHNPQHPYTKELINAVPIPDPHNARQPTELEGSVNEAMMEGEGCRFRDRCPERMDICEQTPAFVDADIDGDNHCVACHLYYDHEEYMDEHELNDPRAELDKVER